MSNEKWIQTVIWSLVFMNLLVICKFFIIPRVFFIFDHYSETREVLLESSGPFDMPNQYILTYKMMNEIRSIVNEEATLFFPPDNWEFGSPRSAVMQSLYPRKIYFSGDSGFKNELIKAQKLEEVYVVFNEDWGRERCKGRSMKKLAGKRFGICRLDKH
jgi:hypothetical protein